MAIDLDALSAPVSEEQPSGPDLSYENARQEIESAFEQSVSTDGGEDEIDWRSTIKLILAEAAKTRDMWLPVYLMRASAKSANFEMLVDGAELLARLVEQRWDDVHPQLDEYGFIGRKTPCESLTTLRDFLNPLAQIPLIEHSRLGRFSGSDFDRFKEQGTSAEGYGMFRALIDSEGVEPLREAAARLDALKDAIKRIDTIMTSNAEGDTSTNFQATYELLDKIRRGVAAQLPADEQPVEDGADLDFGSPGGGGSTPASGGSGGPGFSGGINSRDDVARALDAISQYYSRHEPNSPVPYALRRAKEWISLDFLAVLEDIAPGGLGEAKKILTSGRNTGGSSSGGSDDWSSSAPASASSSSSSDDGWS